MLFPTKTLSASTNKLTLKNGTGAVRADAQCPPALSSPGFLYVRAAAASIGFPHGRNDLVHRVSHAPGRAPNPDYVTLPFIS